MSATKPRDQSQPEAAPSPPAAAPQPQPQPPRQAPRGLDDPGSRRGTTSIIQSFNYAFEGLIWTLRSQRNMRIHFAVATVVLVLAVAYDVSKIELIALLLAIAFVLIAEMVNTAIEAATDIATTSFNPLAKLAKDIAAGAVLVASVIAVVIGYLVLAERVGGPTDRAFERLYNAPIHLTVIALFAAIVLVIALKAVTGRGTPLRGGLPSGHAAVAFAGWAAITLLTDDFDHRVLVSTVAFIMASLVAQTRVESGIHSTLEVALGALLGSLSTLVLFQAFA